jgi:PAS domain S-box-containing protein
MKHADEKVRKSEAKYQNLFENMLEGVYQTRPDGTIIAINPALAKMLGYDSADELISGIRAQDLYTNPEERKKLVRKLEKDGILRNVEINLTRKDGQVITVLESARAVRDENGNICHYEGLLTDITERKLAMEKLRKSEKQLTDAQRIAQLGSWEWNIVQNTTVWSDELYRIFGVRADQFDPNAYETFLNCIHPGDRKRVARVMDMAIKEKSRFDVEYRIISPDDKVRYINARGEVICDNLGRPFKMIGSSQDITDRKNAEEKLRRAYEQLNATLDAMPDLLFDVGVDGHIYDFRAPNPKILYRPPEEFLGKRFEDVLPAPVAATIERAIEKAVEQGHYSGAIYSLEIDGEECWFELSVAARGNPRKDDARFVILVRDITERKQSEIMLKEMAEKLEKERELLKEKNIALRQILEHIENEKLDYRQHILKEMDQAITPLLRKLKKTAGSSRIHELEILEAGFNAILAKDLDDFGKRFARLTPRELQICRLIGGGKSSKQISEVLHLSLLTVSKHRELIRKKMGITNKSINLATYLRSHIQNDSNNRG